MTSPAKCNAKPTGPHTPRPRPDQPDLGSLRHVRPTIGGTAARPICGRRHCGDRGQVGGIEVLPFGFLMFVAVTLIVANAWGVLDARFAVTTAAREAVRAYSEADDIDEATQLALHRAEETLHAYGRGGSRARVSDPVTDGPHRRCGRVSVTVEYDLPVVAVPFIGGFGNAATVESTHTEVIDAFRSGPDGQAQC